MGSEMCIRDRSLALVRFDLGRFDQRGRFASKRDVLTGDVLTMRRFGCGTFWQWDVLTGYRLQDSTELDDPKMLVEGLAARVLNFTQ